MGAFSEPELLDRLVDVRLGLAAVLAREDVRSVHGGDPVGLAAEVAGALRRVVDEHQAQNRPVPPAYVVAFFAVRYVVDRPGLGQPATDRAALEPILLDAVDEALEAAGAYDQGDMRVDADTVRTEVRKGFAGSFDRFAPDPRWGDLLADALVAAIGPDTRSGRVRRLVAAKKCWLARERELRPPGQPQATLRMEWLWKAGHLEIAERLARHGLESDPGKARWLDLLGGVLIKQGRSTEGREVLRRVIRAEPHLLRSRIRLSNDLITRGERDEALAVLSRGLRLSGYADEAAAALIQLGWLRIERREAGIARTVLRTALRRLAKARPTPHNDKLRKQAKMLLERAERSFRH
jgi:tetratricopeptide (TPR) repeat protein